jgi:demethylmenaquinone methyltransferase / 2-methoxy-6-polyprenyl-1,4-benzoquinol methylase
MTEIEIRQDTQNNREGLVEDLFHGTGETYDEVVHFATWGRDKQWKEELLANMNEPKRVLDLACGTGILLLEMCKRFSCHCTGVELREEYLRFARAAADEHGYDVALHCGNAEDYVTDEQFDHITSCYIPKYINLDKTVPHLLSMLAPGGTILMQDFAYPSKPNVQRLFDKHFERMRARFEGDADWETMWSKLPEVLRKTTWIADMTRLLEAGGLEVEVVEQSWGMAALVIGRKPA